MQRLHIKAADGTLTEISPDRIDDAAAAGWLWLDVEWSDEAEVLAVGTRFDLDRLVIEDVLETTHYPKTEDFAEQMLVVAHALGPDEDPTGTVEIDLVFDGSYLLTFHRRPVPTIEWLASQASEARFLTDGGTDRMAARLIEGLARRMLPLIDELDERIDRLEDQALEANPSVVGECQALRHDAIRLRRVLSPQREVLLSLSREGHEFVSERARQRFGDVYDHVYRVVESLDTSRALLSSVLDTYRSSVAESMNDVMKVLTVFSAILLPLSLMAGVYGMNFAHMPELAWRWGYFGLLALMAATAFGLWLYFAHRGFVGGPRLSSLPRAVGKGLGLGVKGIYTIGSAPIRIVAESLGSRTHGSEEGDRRTLPSQGGDDT